jgi:hypothetical protein
MVVIYDRFVFFSVEKFFIPLLYSCLNILVQRSCVSACTRERFCARECVFVCVRASKGVRREKVRETDGSARDGNDLARSTEREEEK